VTTVSAVILLAPISNADDAVRLLANSLLLQAWIPMGSWHYSFNAVTWSISTEMFFYAVFPLALILLRRTSAFVACMLVPAAAMILLASALDLSPVEGGPKATAWGLIYVNPVARVTEFLCGMLAYKLARRLSNAARVWSIAKGTVVELGTFALLLCFMALATYAGIYLLKDVAPRLAIYVQVIAPFPFMAAFIMVMSLEKGLFSKWLSHRFLIYLGEVSFSLYLVHQLVVRWMFIKYDGLIASHWALAYIFYWACSLALAMLLYHLVEKPLRLPIRKLLRGEIRA
jgi:peptidoglycan/LPS O-acetylase OafA/YrhL